MSIFSCDAQVTDYKACLFSFWWTVQLSALTMLTYSTVVLLLSKWKRMQNGDTKHFSWGQHIHYCIVRDPQNWHDTRMCASVLTSERAAPLVALSYWTHRLLTNKYLYIWILKIMLLFLYQVVGTYLFISDGLSIIH